MSLDYSPGKYSCLVTDNVLGETNSENKYPQIVIRFRIEHEYVHDPESGGEVLKTEIQTLEKTAYLVVVPKSLEFVLKKLRNNGWHGTDFADLDLIGKRIICICTHDEYKGKTKEQWDLWAGDFELKAVPGQAKKLNALFGRLLHEPYSPPPKAEPAQQPTQADADSISPQDVPPPEPSADDDVPF